MGLPEPLAKLLKEDRRYKLSAYLIVLEAMTHAQSVRHLGEAERSMDEVTNRHFSGEAFSYILKDYALDQYGFLARAVLEDAGIHTTDDIGAVVYNLIKINMMKKTENDRQEDFHDLFNLKEELDAGFRFRK